ncbi:hypothetical protein SLEP1_g36518 [Rubroshorea leprosula]|nr:hypothetical protein SLEP1_g36518 [Rubroshorea leprosula]
MAKQALDAAMDDKNRKLEFIPRQYTAERKNWQLWWGHQVPAWCIKLEDSELKEHGTDNDNWIIARDEKEALPEANQRFSGKKFGIFQDPDVLDTWFSSGLFPLPLSILGWPDDTNDLKTFYPTSVLETGHGILFFWVARMVMLGIKLGGDVPFTKVFAKRLEESNLDPNEMAVAKAGQVKDFPNGIAECGADALRFSLLSYQLSQIKSIWIFNELLVIDYGVTSFGMLLVMFSLKQSSLTLLEIVWHFSSERRCAKDALWLCLETGLCLLHPFMPFLAEELWQRVPGASDLARKESIMICEYPSPVESWSDDRVKQDMDLVESTVRSLRSLRAELLAKQKNERLPAFALCQTDAVAETIRSHKLEILTLATLIIFRGLKTCMVESMCIKFSPLILLFLQVLLGGRDAAPDGCSLVNVNENLVVFLKVHGILNRRAEVEQRKIKVLFATTDEIRHTVV